METFSLKNFYRADSWQAQMQINKLFVRSILLFFILLAAVIAYYPALGGPFVLDDHVNIPQTKISEITLSSLLSVASGNNSGIFGRPIPVVTFALNHYFGDGSPYPFKVTNLIIHLGNALLVFWFVSLIVNNLSSGKETDLTTRSFLVPLIVTAIWTLHPLQVSTVMYSVQRMTLMMSTFSLLALISYLYAWIHSTIRPAKSILYLLACAIFSILACFSKENGALVILYICFIQLLLNQLAGENITRFRKILQNSVFIITALSVVSGFIYLFLPIDTLIEKYSFREFTLQERIATQGDILILYLKNILLPDISNMNLYLDSYPVIQLHETDAIRSYTILLLMIATAALLYKRHPIFSFGIGFFFISHTLESTIIPLELAFEHRNYIGLIGIALSVVYLTEALGKKIQHSFIKFVVPIIILLLLCTQTYARNIEWGDDIILHSLALENNPGSYRARLALATAYANRSELESAIRLFETSAANNEQDTQSVLRLIQFKAYGAVFNTEEYETARSLLASQPLTTEITMILSNIFHQITTGIYSLPNLDHISELFKIASKNPVYIFGPNHKAALHARFSMLLSLQENHQDALAELQKAHQLNSRNPEIIILTAEKLMKLNRQHEISDVIKLLPNDIEISDDQAARIVILDGIIANSRALSEIRE